MAFWLNELQELSYELVGETRPECSEYDSICTVPAERIPKQVPVQLERGRECVR